MSLLYIIVMMPISWSKGEDVFPTDNEFEQFATSPSYRLLTAPNRIPLEQVVSSYYGYAWHVKTFQDMNDYAAHPSAILSNGRDAVFIKMSEAPNGPDQFEVELTSLNYLSERAGVLTPTPVGIVPVERGVILVLEAVQADARTPQSWSEMGRTLARIHQVKGQRYGSETHGSFGPLYQDNRPLENWLDFYCERRLWPRLIGAIDSNNLPTSAIRMVEQFIVRLPHLDIPLNEPCLVHGDAHHNNFISARQGTLVIDPAIYFGTPEIDLAYVDFFQPVPEEVFISYREILPIDPGLSKRRELWRIHVYLAMIQVGALDYLRQLTDAVKLYL